VALTQRISKLEKKVADRAQTAQLDDRVVYQPSAEELAEAVAILVGCGAVQNVIHRLDDPILRAPITNTRIES
jgi:hypothetical protein